MTIFQRNIDILIQEWLLLLKISNEKSIFTHIPSVLFIQFYQNAKFIEQYDIVINSYAKKNNCFLEDFKFNVSKTSIKWKIPFPRVSIIIPTKNNHDFLKRFIYSIDNLTDYKNYELIIVDNQSESIEIKKYYQHLEEISSAKIIFNHEKFNYSKANNLGASKANGEFLLFMNDDMEIVDPSWLNELVQWALIPGIGIVGAKLLYPNTTIQHAGVVIGMQGIGGHIYQHLPNHFWGMMGSTDWFRNVSAVTGACQIIRKPVFEELGGYDENFKLTFSDIDLCYSAIKKGYRVLYNPNSIIIHHQGASRGYFTPEEDIALARVKLKELLEKGDPYYSRNLTLSSIPNVKF